MHAEKILSIAREINSAFGTEPTSQRLRNLIDAINNRVSQPTSPEAAEAVANQTKKFFRALGDSKLNTFPPTWRKILTELDLQILLPQNIRNAVEEAFQSNIFESEASKSLSELATKIDEKLKNLALLQNGLEHVGIKADDLPNGGVEFEVAMPREAITDDLLGFSKELNALNNEMRVLADITQQGPPPFTLNSVSTNDFTVAININADLGEVLLYLLGGILLIKSQFQTKRDTLQENFSDLPASLLDGFKKWVTEYQRERFSELIDRLGKEFPDAVNTESLTRMKGRVLQSMEYLSDKQEDGFNMDVRVNPSATEDPSGEQDAERQSLLSMRREQLLRLAKLSAELKVIQRQTNPVRILAKKEEEIPRDKPDEPS